MKPKDTEGVLTIHQRGDRLVSGPTAWWLDKAPKAYRYYCIHSLSLTDYCDKCKRGVMRFTRAAA